MSTFNEQLAMMRDEHRLAMAAVLNELATYVRSKENNGKQARETALRQGRKSRAKRLGDEIEIWSAMRKRMAELRTEHNVLSLGNRVLAMSNFCDRNVGDPTPEEIAKACEEFQASWSPQERARRGAVEPDPVEVRPLKCDHLFR